MILLSTYNISRADFIITTLVSGQDVCVCDVNVIWSTQFRNGKTHPGSEYLRLCLFLIQTHPCDLVVNFVYPRRLGGTRVRVLWPAIVTFFQSIVRFYWTNTGMVFKIKPFPYLFTLTPKERSPRMLIRDVKFILDNKLIRVTYMMLWLYSTSKVIKFKAKVYLYFWNAL